MTVCSIYMDRCSEIRDLLSAELDAMPDLNACTSVTELATVSHEAYSAAVKAMIEALEHIDEAAGEMMTTLGMATAAQGSEVPQ